MLFQRKFKQDKYLQKFVNYCEEKFGDNLAAIVVFGSYALGYFDKRKSDYDVFIIFKEKVPRGKSTLKKKFTKCASTLYYLNLDQLLIRAHIGHFTSYITLLTKGSAAIYKTKEYKRFLKRLRGINLLEEIIDVAGIEYKANFEREALENSDGWKAIKWTLPSIRKRLQLLTYIDKKKLIWDFEKNVRFNKNIFNKNEKDFLLGLNKKLYNRSEKFSNKDKEIALEIFDKLNKELLLKELKQLLNLQSKV